MDGAAFIKNFREETMDEATPHLWSDALVLRYLDEAQVAFCRQTEGIADRLLLTIPALSPMLVLSPKVRKVRAATLVRGGREIDLLSVEQARAQGILPGAEGTGTPRALVMGAVKNRLQVYPAPVADESVLLDVFRLPNTTITAPGDELEVGDEYATDLMLFALSRAYARPDPDTMDRTRSEAFREAFDVACTRASREQGRARKPNGATMFSW